MFELFLAIVVIAVLWPVIRLGVSFLRFALCGVILMGIVGCVMGLGVQP
jgi:hypothetical protein